MPVREPFPALVLEKPDDEVQANLQSLQLSDLPDQGDVLVEVDYSSLNYKDGLAVSDRGRIVRGYPIVPGVDLAGTVVESASAAFSPGDRILVTGRGIGEDHWGGYSRYQRIQAEWAVPVPDSLSLHQAMIIGTAGYTAMLSVMTLEEHGLTPTDGEVVVTGASGGVGSMAVTLLARADHDVTASTGRLEEEDWLRSLGASALIHRRELGEAEPRPMRSERWSGAVDTVGGSTLATLIASMRRHASIAACGLAASPELSTTVFPFILRGVNLLGIDSNYCPAPRRQAAWQRLARDLDVDILETLTHATIPLSEVPDMSQTILAGQVRGRVVVDLTAS